MSEENPTRDELVEAKRKLYSMLLHIKLEREDEVDICFALSKDTDITKIIRDGFRRGRINHG